MKDEKNTNTNDHSDMEGKGRESIGDSSGTGYRPEDGKKVGGPGTTTLGIRSVERGRAPVHGAQASQAGTGGRSCPLGTQIKGKDGLLPGEAGGHSPKGGGRSIGVYHSQVPASEGFDPAQHQETPSPIPERYGHEAQ